MEVIKLDELPIAVSAKAISKCLEEVSDKDREYIEQRAEKILSLNNAANKNYLEIGKCLAEIKARFVSEKPATENGEDEEPENFIEYIKLRFTFSKSTAYGLAKTWESWKDFDLTKIPTMFAPSTLLILAGDGLQELRERIVQLAEKYHISASMARNALKLWKSGASTKGITISRIATQQKEIAENSDKEDGKKESPEVYKHGNSVEIRILRHGAGDEEVIEALQSALTELGAEQPAE